MSQDSQDTEPRRRIMVVDDAEDIHDLVRIWLMDEAVELISVSGGGSCLARVGDERPDLILLDVDMPELDGFAVCRALKEQPATQGIPVIFLTGASSPEEKLQGLELGAIDYITKPFDPAELRARVRAALRTRTLMDLLEQRALVLQQSEEEFRATFELASVGKAQVDTVSGRFLRVNPKFCNIVGYSHEQLQQRTFYSILHTSEQSASADVARLIHGEVPDETIEHRCLRQDGQTVWVEVSAAPIKDASGKTVRVVCVVQDITARKQAETLEQIQRELLQMVASGQPLDVALRHLMRATADHCESMSPGLLLLKDGRFHLAAGLEDQTILLTQIEQYSTRLAADFNSRATAIGDVIHTAGDDPAWSFISDPAQPPASAWFSGIHSGTSDMLGFFLLVGSAGRPPTPFQRQLLQAVSRLAMIAVEHRQMADRMTYQAQHDALTGLPNRLLFEDRLQQAISWAHREASAVALIYADLDRFKVVNDTLGHHAGDELLQAVVARWKLCLRDADTLARLGGDEFALVLPNLGHAIDAATVAQRLLDSLRAPMIIAGTSVVATASIGVAVYPHDGATLQELQQNADAAMYRTKRSGRNGFRCSSPDSRGHDADRLDLENQLRGAVQHDELLLHYQPLVDRDMRVTGLEALLRWTSSKYGDVAPIRFIPIAEEVGLVVPIGTWVLTQACRDLRLWLDAGLPAVPVSVNVSALQFARPDFVETVLRLLNDYRIEGHLLGLEITETVLMHSREDLSPLLLRLRERGVHVAIDDFGTGYSSLAYLQRLPIDTLKIDRTFVKDLEEPPGKHGGGLEGINPKGRGAAIIRAIISMAHKLDLKVVAEGVETQQQLRFLHASDCDRIQGFLTGRPIPSPEVAALLADTRRRATRVTAA